MCWFGPVQPTIDRRRPKITSFRFVHAVQILFIQETSQSLQEQPPPNMPQHVHRIHDYITYCAVCSPYIQLRDIYTPNVAPHWRHDCHACIIYKRSTSFPCGIRHVLCQICVCIGRGQGTDMCLYWKRAGHGYVSVLEEGRARICVCIGRGQGTDMCLYWKRAGHGYVSVLEEGRARICVCIGRGQGTDMCLYWKRAWHGYVSVLEEGSVDLRILANNVFSY